MAYGNFSGDPWVICTAASEAYWRSQSLLPASQIVVATEEIGFSRVQVVFDRTTPVGTREDVVLFSMNWAQAIGQRATALTIADMAAVETALNAWWTLIKPLVTGAFSLRDYVWFSYQPITPKPGARERQTPVGVPGTASTGRVPDQIAVTQTFKTLSRTHWGRVYLPGVAMGNVDISYGRLTSGAQDAYQSAMHTLLSTQGASGSVCPVVGSIPYTGVMGIEELQTDNIFDIQRRRRPKQASRFVTQEQPAP